MTILRKASSSRNVKLRDVAAGAKPDARCSLDKQDSRIGPCRVHRATNL
jgi:hypothetical protein